MDASPDDSDSNPNNNQTLVPNEDDEGVVNFVPANNLNGNTAEFRAMAAQAQSVIIQQIAPNPAREILNIRIFSNEDKEVTVHVLSPQGQILMSQKEQVKKGVYYSQIAIADLNSGMYFIQLGGTGSRRVPLKFVKARL